MEIHSSLMIRNDGYVEYTDNQGVARPASVEDIASALTKVVNRKRKTKDKELPFGNWPCDPKGPWITSYIDSRNFVVFTPEYMSTIFIPTIYDKPVPFLYPEMMWIFKDGKLHVEVWKDRKWAYESPFPNDSHGNVCMNITRKDFVDLYDMFKTTWHAYMNLPFTEFRDKTYESANWGSMDAKEFWKRCFLLNQIDWDYMTNYEI